MAGGLRKLGAAFVELYADRKRLEADLAAARQAVEQYSEKVKQLQEQVAANAIAAQQKEFGAFTSAIDAKVAKLKAARDAENAPDDSAAYQAKLQAYAVEAEMQKRALAAERERVALSESRATAVAAEAAQTETLAQGIRNATAGARALRTAIMGIVGVVGSVVAVVGLLVAGFVKVKDAITGSAAEAKKLEDIEKKTLDIIESANKALRERQRIKDKEAGVSSAILGDEDVIAVEKRLQKIDGRIESTKKTIADLSVRINTSEFVGPLFLSDDLDRAKKKLEELEKRRIAMERLLADAKQAEADKESNAESERIKKETKERIAGILAASKAKRDAASDRTYEEMLSGGLLNLYRQQMMEGMNADAERFKQKQALDQIEHDAKMEAIKSEHEQAMRLQEEFYRGIRAQFTGIGGLRRLADLSRIIERMSRSV